MDKNIFKSYSLLATTCCIGIGIFLGRLAYLYNQGAFKEANEKTMEIIYHDIFSIFGLLSIVIMGGLLIVMLSKFKGH